MRAILSGAIALGVVGNINAYSKDPSTLAISHTLRETSIYVFLVMTVFAALQAVQLAIGELNYSSQRNSPYHSIWVLEALMLLLLIREGFAAANVRNAAQANNEALWYPLSALPELLAALLFAAPGLVWARSESIRDE